ncbi:MAG: VOC family protein [Caulobacteraceae bacterium]|nr:VOC family protein [Caulobacteraceae bacterium]
MLKLGPPLVLTPDLAEARVLYGDILGLPIAAEFTDQIVFSLDDTTLHVFRCENPAARAQHGRDAACVITFEVDSLTEVLQVLENKGVRVLHHEPAWNADVHWAYAAFEGPGGLVHELVERRKR